MSSAIRPKLYRVLTRLMIEGWREEFNDPQLPVAVIGFCAGGETQNEENFEKLSIEGGPGSAKPSASVWPTWRVRQSPTSCLPTTSRSPVCTQAKSANTVGAPPLGAQQRL
jgi:hypothetical protein